MPRRRRQQQAIQQASARPTVLEPPVRYVREPVRYVREPWVTPVRYVWPNWPQWQAYSTSATTITTDLEFQWPTTASVTTPTWVPYPQSGAFIVDCNPPDETRLPVCQVAQDELRTTDAARRRAAIMERAAASNRAAAIEREQAIERAEQLLRGCLTRAQIEELDMHRRITIAVTDKQGRPRIFVLGRGRVANILERNAQGGDVARWCVHPRMEVPDADTMLAQKLWLENDCDELLRIANRHPI